MQKTRKKRTRVLSALLAATFVLLQAVVTTPGQVEAASTVDAGSVNLLKHSTFEEEDVPLEEHTEPAQLDNWYYFSDKTEKVSGQGHDSDWAVKLGATDCALEQDVADLKIGATYTATVWAKATNPGSATAYFGVKNYGGQEIKVKIDSAEYKQYEIPFTYTGAPQGKYPRVYVWVERLYGGEIYVDDFALMIDSDLQQMSIENGKITATYRDDYTGTPSKDDFTATYRSSLDAGDAKELPITDAAVNGGQLEMSFAPIEAQPLEQTITVDVTYVPKNQTLTLDYVIAPNGEEVVTADVAAFQAENGTATAVLDKDPTVSPAQADFTLQRSVNGGEFEAVAINAFSYDKASKTVTLDFPMTDVKAEDQNVTLKLTYNTKEYTADYTVKLGDSTTYYVDATGGSDSNNGKSPETAIASIDKVNTIQFQPGDKLLFKCGEQWTGALKPMGSGVEGAPIVIASYGEGEKPLLKPGANWRIDYFNVANKVIWSPTVNNVITFYNQEYWEVRDLELYDPSYASNASTSIYRRGINISAKDVGDLHYFKFDNLTIHGFRGPNSNEGKSSGGIIMTVYSDPYNSANRVPTAVHDITVTNCEMYDLGRSGFNFVSPWTTRTGDEWGAFDYRGYGDWKPYENITIKNNTIYNIDGDGILIDGCKNVLVEHNTVSRAVINCWFGVGMFNWNSDNTVFQFNEIYNTFPADSLLGAGDGQGIEIDALNRDTWVQYNYIHDNTGGTIMWCATSTLRTIRGTYRYNISQNDLTKHGIIDWRPNHKESMAYNNVFYLGELPEGSSRQFMNNGYANGASDAKFYNNIFYNLDDINLNTFNEQEIDWKNNVFYGFESVPSNDTAVITEDPMFVAPGTGALGIDTLDGYKLQAGSPAIDAGLNIEENGGRDYFGTPLTDGKTDIGAAEYVSAPVNKSTLKIVLDLANAHVAAGDVDKLIPTAKEQFNTALTSAQAIYDDPASTQEQVDKAWKTLMNVIHALNFVPGDKTDLATLVEQAKGLNLDEYLDGAEKDAFTAALTEAEAMIADQDAMKADIDAAYKVLDDAMKALVPKPEPGDKSELKKVIDEGDVKTAELDKYVDDKPAKEAFADALQAAKDMYGKEDATQEEIDAAKLDLLIAMNNLRLRADKSNLNDWLEKLKAIDLSEYTAETADVVRAVIARAEVLASKDLGDNEIDQIEAMVAEMMNAEAQLVKSAPEEEDPGSSSTPSDNSKPEEESSSSSNGGKTPTTGDSLPVVALSVMALASAGAWLLLKRKK